MWFRVLARHCQYLTIAAFRFLPVRPMMKCRRHHHSSLHHDRYLDFYEWLCPTWYHLLYPCHTVPSYWMVSYQSRVVWIVAW